MRMEHRVRSRPMGRLGTQGEWAADGLVQGSEPCSHEAPMNINSARIQPQNSERDRRTLRAENYGWTSLSSPRGVVGQGNSSIARIYTDQESTHGDCVMRETKGSPRDA